MDIPQYLLGFLATWTAGTLAIGIGFRTENLEREEASFFLFFHSLLSFLWPVYSYALALIIALAIVCTLGAYVLDWFRPR